jgi:hypothetical protein
VPPPEPPLEKALRAFEQDPLYLVHMVEAAALLIHKRGIWQQRRADSLTRTTPTST